jgi:hypothetical protein
MPKVDLLEQRYRHYLYIGLANKVVAEVYVLDEKHIVDSLRTRKGKIRLVKAV